TDLESAPAVAVQQELGRLEQAAGVLVLFLAAAGLALMLAGLDHALVADADGHEMDALLRDRERRVHHHAEQAELRRQELARAAAPPFQEQLDGGAVSDQPPHVAVDDGRIELVAL